MSDDVVSEQAGAALCLDFANTWSNRADRTSDRLGSYLDLCAWGRQADLLEEDESRRLGLEAGRRPDEAAAVLSDAVTLREAIFGVFSTRSRGESPADVDIEVLNRALTAALPRLQLRPGGACCRWEWAGPEDALDRMLWPVARSAAELLTSQLSERVRECASPSCSWLFLDGSRNGRRKWCDMATCGNRAKARRYYRRHGATTRREEDARR